MERQREREGERHTARQHGAAHEGALYRRPSRLTHRVALKSNQRPADAVGAMPAQPSGTRLFLKGARHDFRHTGAIAPSSRFLARAITSAIDPERGPLKALEAGAGTGALTVEILKRLPEGSHLDIYEINPTFAEHLARRFCEDGKGGSRRARVEVSVHNRRVQDLGEHSSYDAIVSGLPLNNFKPSQVRQILETLMGALRPGGVLSWFEYLLIRELKSIVTARSERRRLKRIGRLTGGYLDRYEFRREAIFLNIPPAVVHHLRKG
jgi:phosphatidylethanolamine/phosphatidyl-N-methylethanolamine N-methyltransferase